MTILHVTPSYKPAYIYGGPIISVSKLAENQSELGISVTILTTTANGKEELITEPRIKQIVNGITVQYFPRWTKDHTHFSPGLLWALFKTARSYDVIHIHSWWNLVAMLSVLVCWLKGVRPVLSPRGMLSGYTLGKEGGLVKKWLHRLFGKWLLSKTVLHGTVPAEVEEARKFNPNWEYFVAPNIVDLPQVTNTTRSNSAPPSLASSGGQALRVVFLSRIDPKKGLDITFEALANVNIPWHLSIAGKDKGPYSEELKALSKRLNICQHITWLGWLSGDQKYEALQEADLFILTSRNENFANVVLESLACGTPVLVSKNVGLSEYIAQYPELGHVCSLNTNDIAQHIEEIYQNQKTAGIDRPNIRQQVLADFDSQKIAREYLEAYRTIFSH